MGAVRWIIPVESLARHRSEGITLRVWETDKCIKIYDVINVVTAMEITQERLRNLRGNQIKSRTVIELFLIALEENQLMS